MAAPRTLTGPRFCADDTTPWCTIAACTGKSATVGTSGQDADFTVLRYTTAGALDTTFGGSGYIRTDFNARSIVPRDSPMPGANPSRPSSVLM